MLSFYPERLLSDAALGHCNFTRRIVHLQTFFHVVFFDHLRQHPHRNTLFVIDQRPERICLCQPLSVFRIHKKITQSHKAAQLVWNRPDPDFFSEGRIAVYNHLPRAHHPEQILFFQKINANSEILRLKRRNILKIIHDRRQAQQSVFPGFAVAHSAVKCIHIRLSSGTGCALFCDYYSRNPLVRQPGIQVWGF